MTHDPPVLPPRLGRTGWMLAGGLILLVLASTWTGWANHWVQDDIPIILDNQTAHSLGLAWHGFLEAYWPAPYTRELYRPLTIMLFAVQWLVGEGSPVVFRLVSTALYAGVVLAVWRLAGRLMPMAMAWVVAALFAVHPVHVEAVAVAVNQAELLVALIAVLMVTAWYDRRTAGLPTGGGWGAGMVATYMVAMLVKEHALVIPFLIAAMEWSILDDERPLRSRLKAHLSVISGAIVSVALMVAVRRYVLIGNTRGTFTAEGLVSSGLGGRAMTMLGVVPEWFRLLIWPHHLQADYSPREIVPATGFGINQVLGVILLGLALVILLRCRRRLPVASFGAAWLAIGLGPVHNVLVPTGIVLAERTLFLGSIGFVLGGVVLIHAGWRTLEGADTRVARALATVGIGVLLLLGVSRSASRQRVWHDQATLWRQTVIDAPLSYRAHRAWAEVLFHGGAKGPGEQHYLEAIALYPAGWPVYLDLADRYRIAGQCYPAMELYQQALTLSPNVPAGRASLVACLVHLGRFREAAAEARTGALLALEAVGDPRLDSILADAHITLTRYAEIADSAATVGAAPGSVSLPPPPERAVDHP
ncbi:MAG: tetratricopeptide repeat protein [Gemmatimonadota bacterium]